MTSIFRSRPGSGRAGLAGLLLAAAVPAAVPGCAADSPPAEAGEAAPQPPAGAVELLNRAVFIPGGNLEAGSEDWTEDFPVGSPFSKVHEVRRSWTVPSFWLQRHEVTNEEYRRHHPDHSFPEGREAHPVTGLTWSEAMAYAEAVGGTLPNDVQWEYAARGAEGREYPWGDAPPTCERAHFAGCDPPSTVPVMSRSGDVTPEGVHDLAGNVREWVTPVWFDPERHPVNHEARRLKGGSFKHPAFFLRGAALTKDIEDDYRWDNIGFRVAWPVP